VKTWAQQCTDEYQRNLQAKAQQDEAAARQQIEDEVRAADEAARVNAVLRI
jgi:hypothetical protein